MCHCSDGSVRCAERWHHQLKTQRKASVLGPSLEACQRLTHNHRWLLGSDGDLLSAPSNDGSGPIQGEYCELSTSMIYQRGVVNGIDQHSRVPDCFQLRPSEYRWLLLVEPSHCLERSTSISSQRLKLVCSLLTSRHGCNLIRNILENVKRLPISRPQLYLESFAVCSDRIRRPQRLLGVVCFFWRTSTADARASQLERRRILPIKQLDVVADWHRMTEVIERRTSLWKAAARGKWYCATVGRHLH